MAEINTTSEETKAAIAKTSEETKEAIKRKTAFSLPNAPSSVGYTPDEIKKAFYTPITDDKDSIQAELDRIVKEANTALSENKAAAESYADKAARTAEQNAGNHAESVASTAEQNAKSYVDDRLGDIGAAIDELKDYANGLIGGAG